MKITLGLIFCLLLGDFGIAQGRSREMAQLHVPPAQMLIFSISNHSQASNALAKIRSLIAQIESGETSFDQKTAVAGQLAKIGKPSIRPVEDLLQQSLEQSRSLLIIYPNPQIKPVPRDQKQYSNYQDIIMVCVNLLGSIGDRQSLLLLKQVPSFFSDKTERAIFERLVGSNVEKMEARLSLKKTAPATPKIPLNEELDDLAFGLISSATSSQEKQMIVERFIEIGSPSVDKLIKIINGVMASRATSLTSTIRGLGGDPYTRDHEILMACAFALGEISNPKALSILAELDRRYEGTSRIVQEAIEKINNRRRTKKVK